MKYIRSLSLILFMLFFSLPYEVFPCAVQETAVVVATTARDEAKRYYDGLNALHTINRKEH
jgi:hypothetical protein